jgi:hypothetical protein
MNQTQTSTTVKVLSPTLHLYHYVLRNAINERPETLENRRKFFSDNLHKLGTHLTSSTGKIASDFVKLVPIEQDPPESGTILDLTNVPTECLKPNDDRLYLDTGIICSRLAARRLKDTYLLRFTSYVPSIHQEQPLPIFANLGENIASLPLELGQTVILAAILPTSHYSLPDIPLITTECFKHYYGTPVAPDKLIVNEFLGSPFCIYAQPITFKFDKYTVETIHLACVFLYRDITVEQQADKVYLILQNMLLSYHKIHFFHSQSTILKKILAEQYEAIELLSKEYPQRQWNSQSYKKLPQQSLEYYKNLSFLEDQAKTIEINLKNYQECIRQIEEKTRENVPEYFTKFEQESNHHLEQIKINIGFLSPGIQLYDKLMLSIQTQVSIDEATSQNQRSEQQAQLGQILAGVGAAIGVGQIITPPITATVSQYFDKGKTQPSVLSLWLGAGLAISVSILAGCYISRKVYQWFTKQKN